MIGTIKTDSEQNLCHKSHGVDHKCNEAQNSHKLTRTPNVKHVLVCPCDGQERGSNIIGQTTIYHIIMLCQDRRISVDVVYSRRCRALCKECEIKGSAPQSPASPSTTQWARKMPPGQPPALQLVPPATRLVSALAARPTPRVLRHPDRLHSGRLPYHCASLQWCNWGTKASTVPPILARCCFGSLTDDIDVIHAI